MTAQPVVVWAEIPVTDMEKAMAYYGTVFGYKMVLDTSGPNPMAILNNEMENVAGHLYPGKPAPAGQGPTVHLETVDTLEAAVERCKAAGGTVLSEPIAIPSGRFVYTQDPDGNSIGIYKGN